MFLYVRNSQTATIDLYVTRIELPLLLWLVVALAAGIGLATLASLPRAIQARRESRNLKKQLQDCHRELENLRTLPLQDKH